MRLDQGLMLELSSVNSSLPQVHPHHFPQHPLDRIPLRLQTKSEWQTRVHNKQDSQVQRQLDNLLPLREIPTEYMDPSLGGYLLLFRQN
jgi:hypothetical protein